MRKAMMHLAQFLCHSPTYHSLAMWRHPRTIAAGYDWARPELYQHIARVCERGAMWIVYPKGIRAVTQNDVLAAGRALGLLDVKVISFSAARTALRFVAPRRK